MAHLVFVVGLFAFFISLFSLPISLVSFAALKDERARTGRTLLLAGFLVATLSQAVELYLEKVLIIHHPWIYEIRELALVFMIPTFAGYANAGFSKRVKTRLNLGFWMFTGAALGAYIYGNYVNPNRWAIFYPVYGGGFAASFIYSSMVHAIRPRSTGSTRRNLLRIPGIVSLSFALAFAVLEILPRFSLRVSRVLPLDLLVIPLVVIMWCIVFLVEDIRSLVRRTPKTGVFDMENVGEKYGLSQREREVVTLLVKGSRYHEIAEELFISKATVKTHINRVYGKLGVNSKMELVHKLLS